VTWPNPCMCSHLLPVISHSKGFTRISDLAKSLHVQPPSASKMVNKLADMNYLMFEKYGIIQLNEQGMSFGKYLLERHQTIEKFLNLIGVTDNILEETEKIEHCINEDTLSKIRAIIDFSQENPQVMELYKQFLLCK